MIDTYMNTICFGTGDVGMWVGLAGTEDAPEAAVIFRNQDPQPIRGVQKDEDLGDLVYDTIDLSESFLIRFSNPESVDAVISVLEAAKRAAFESGSRWPKY